LIPSEVLESIRLKLSAILADTVKIKNTAALAGGCIHHASKLQTTNGDFFLKWNKTGEFDNFSVEAKNLKLLSTTRTVNVPDFICVEKTANYCYIILKFIEPAKKQTDFWENFGKNLALLHRNTSPKYGLEYNNFIGALPQSNKFTSDWISFFINERLEKQLKLAWKNKLFDLTISKKFEALYKKLGTIFPLEKPALIHGDLWGGNYTAGGDGYASLFDPAVYFGHREIELAFTKLFGSFDQRFYDSYQEAFPLEPGFETRADVYNLYPLLVHVNLFGTSYMKQVNSILERFK
jgi:protein-ribulosamine 3-kinase